MQFDLAQLVRVSGHHTAAQKALDGDFDLDRYDAEVLSRRALIDAAANSGSSLGKTLKEHFGASAAWSFASALHAEVDRTQINLDGSGPTRAEVRRHHALLKDLCDAVSQLRAGHSDESGFQTEDMDRLDQAKSHFACALSAAVFELDDQDDLPLGHAYQAISEALASLHPALIEKRKKAAARSPIQPR